MHWDQSNDEEVTYGHAQFLRQGIYFRMFQQLRAVVVDLRHRGIGFEGSARKFVREVFARVEVLEEAGYGIYVVVDEFNTRVPRGGELLREERRLGEESFVRHKEGLRIAAADEEFDHGGFEVAR